MLKGCDLDTHLTPALIAALMAADIVAAGRYTKNLTAVEVEAAREVGFGLWLIAEGEGDLTTMEGGANQGQSDGINAANAAKALGFDGGVIFFAVDFSATAANAPIIAAYTKGFFQGVTPFRGGIYADGAILEAQAPSTPTYIAGAGGWPGTQDYVKSGRAALIQHPTITFGATSIDPVDIIDTSVVWWPKGAPQPATQEPIAATMPQATTHMPPLATLQQWLVADGATIAIDGVWGPQTAAAVARAYS